MKEKSKQDLTLKSQPHHFLTTFKEGSQQKIFAFVVIGDLSIIYSLDHHSLIFKGNAQGQSNLLVLLYFKHTFLPNDTFTKLPTRNSTSTTITNLLTKLSSTIIVEFGFKLKLVKRRLTRKTVIKLPLFFPHPVHLIC